MVNEYYSISPLRNLDFPDFATFKIIRRMSYKKMLNMIANKQLLKTQKQLPEAFKLKYPAQDKTTLTRGTYIFCIYLL